MTFKEKLKTLINSCSIENASNTPDFILADYLQACLAAFEVAVNERDSSHGIKLAEHFRAGPISS